MLLHYVRMLDEETREEESIIVPTVKPLEVGTMVDDMTHKLRIVFLHRFGPTAQAVFQQEFQDISPVRPAFRMAHTVSVFESEGSKIAAQITPALAKYFLEDGLLGLGDALPEEPPVLVACNDVSDPNIAISCSSEDMMEIINYGVIQGMAAYHRELLGVLRKGAVLN